jgi:3-deoxy-manno-octulosonate cytidylyltransferase (CMP-KDO synthetase)
MKQIQITGIIPARFDSSRFPGKPLQLILGVSMIERVYKQCLKSKLLTNLVVATDDDRIFEHVINFGGKAVMTDKSHPSGTDRCLQAAKTVTNTLQEYSKHVVVNIQGDEPFIHPELIDKVASLFTEENVHIATAASPFRDLEQIQNPNTVKIVRTIDNYALYFSRSPIPFFQNTAATPSDYSKHMGIYAYTLEVLEKLCNLPQSFLEKTESLEQLRWIENGYQIKITDFDSESLCVDVPDDIRKAEEFMKMNNLT